MLWLLIYLVLSIVFLIDIMMSITTLEYVKQAVSVRERPKLIEKIQELKDLQKFCIIWPFILFKIIKNK